MGNCCLHTCASFTKQCNLVPTNGRWCLATREVTAGLSESTAAYRQVYGFGHLRAGCRRPESAPEPHARFEWKTFTFTYFPPVHLHVQNITLCRNYVLHAKKRFAITSWSK